MIDCATPAPPLVFNNLLQTICADDLAWQPLREGIQIARVYASANGGAAMAFIRFAPGARLPRHEHDGYEHIFVLSGSQHDDRGDYYAGALLINPPGSTHEVISPQGCIVLAYWERPVRFL